MAVTPPMEPLTAPAVDGVSSDAPPTATALARRTRGIDAWLQRRLGVTVSGVGVIAFAVAGYAVARRLQSPALYLLVYGLILGFVGLFALGRRKLAVEAERSQLPSRVRAGQQVDVTLQLKANRRLSTIVLQEDLSPWLGDTVSVPIPLLPAGEVVEHAYSFTPRLRGKYAVGPLVATWSDPFGLTHRRQVVGEPVEVIVHPDTEGVQDRILSREWEDPPIRPPRSKPWPTGFEFYGMRDYVSGDDPRRIVWRKTAQTLDLDTGEGRYLVRESEQGITDRVAIVFDTDPKAHSRGTPSETFETAVRVVSSLGVRHIKDGFSVAVYTDGSAPPMRLRGPSSRIALLDTMAVVAPGSSPLTTSLERILVDAGRAPHMVVVTPFLDQDAAVRLRLVQRRGVSLVVILIVTDDPADESLHRAGGLGCSVVEVDASTPLEKVSLKLAAGRA